MVLKIDFKKLIKNISIPILVGVISGLLTKNGVEYFSQNAVKPFFTPPDWLFPIAWTVLYILMGIASYLVDVGDISSFRSKGLLLFYIQLAFNFTWSFIFFNAQAYFTSLVWIIAMLGLIIATTVNFYKVNKISAYLMMPYIIWVCFATVLNFGVYLLN